VLVKQIDDLDLESLERGLGDLCDMLRAAIHAPTGIQFESELGGDYHLVTEGRESFAHELFVREGTIDFSRIEKGHPSFDCGPQKRDHLLLVFGRTIGIAHAHTPEPKSRDFQVAISKFALLHF
jgi:hypothetical protein